MLAKVFSYALYGLEGKKVDIEVDMNNGIPSYDIVGLADTSVKESKERVRSAIKNSGRSIPNRKITINLAPADLKKEGSSLDLGVAIGILKASSQLIADTDGYIFLGELSLDGSLRKINGVLPIVISALADGYKKFIVPLGNEKEASFIQNADVYAINSLKDVIDFLSGLKNIEIVKKRNFYDTDNERKYFSDISYVKGQKIAKRALEIAVSGNHNVLLVGPPGTGKTMLAKCIPSIMPDMTFNEALECTKIHSVAGYLSENEGILSVRPFRSPHHTATTVSMTGGGNKTIKPGEISLAHNGVLFLDEMPEYSRATLESLRQPLEDGVITISRANYNVTYPADFMLCGSMNPCPCGNFGSKDKECKCTPREIEKYKAKISGPLLDRIDLKIEVDSVKYSELLSEEKTETSADVRKRVNRTRKIQLDRFSGSNIYTNSQMGEREIKKYCLLDSYSEEILKNAYNSLKLSARGRSRIIKVARTIADMAEEKNILPVHILEAISYRQIEK